MNNDTQRDDNKTIREECTRELLIHLLNLHDAMFAETNKLSRISLNLQNTSTQDKIMYEVLINKKTFAELGILNNLTSHRQKELFVNAVKKVINNFERFNTKISFYRELEQKYDALLEEKSKLDCIVDKQRKIPSAVLEKLKLRIEDTDLSNRVKQICESGNIKTLRDLVKLSRKEFQMNRNCGKLSADEAEAYLKNSGLNWFMDID